MRRRPYYYLVGRIGGRVTFDGPFLSESLAYEKANVIQDWDEFPDIKCFTTSNLQEAKSTWRSEQALKTGQLGPTLLPIRNIRTAQKWGKPHHDRANRYEEIKESRGLGT